MKQALALILAGSAFGAATAGHAAPVPAAPVPAAHALRLADPAPQPAAPILVDDGDEGGGWLLSNGGGSDDGNGGGSDSDDCNPDEDATCTAANAAPAGTTAPPKNGLFTDGTAPVVTSN